MELETRQTDFAKALQRCIDLGCGRTEDRHGRAKPWEHSELATAIKLSDRRMIYAYLNEREYPSEARFAYVLDAFSAKSDEQVAAVENLKVTFDKRPKKRRSETSRKTKPAAPPPPIPVDARPYRGLEAFREEDAHLFFGRDALTKSVLGKLDHNRLVLLAGASGSGKSSLINAAVIPSIRKRGGHHIVRCTPGDRAIANLAAALARALGRDRSPAELLADQKSYREALLVEPEAIRDIAQLLPDGRLFLVLDQFEETFTLTNPINAEQHEALIALLLAIVRSPDEQKLTALLGMRSDFLAELETADPRLVQCLDNAMVQMRAMLPPELERAITAPAEQYGVTLEPGLLTAVIDELAGDRDALPLLEVALDELWTHRDETRRCLTLAALSEIGGITGALARRADLALDNLGFDESLVRRLLLELVRVNPDETAEMATRHPRTKDELDAIDRSLWPIGERLASRNLRLLVTTDDAATGIPVIDLTHEALLRKWPTLAQWIDEEREFLRFRDHLDRRIADFKTNAGDAGYLLPRIELQRAKEWLAQRPDALRGNRAEFIAASAVNQAEAAARVLWERLELSFYPDDEVPANDRHALAALRACGPDIRGRFLWLAVTDRDAARKFEFEPELAMSAALGLVRKARSTSLAQL